MENNNQASIDLIENLQSYASQFKEHEPKVMCKIYYKEKEKSFIKFVVNSKLLKSINPGLMFLSKKQSYFKNSHEMCYFFIKEILSKQPSTNANKEFSRYEISIKELEKIKIEKFKNLLDEKLEYKPNSGVKFKI